MLSSNGIGELPEGYTDRLIKYPFTFLSETKLINQIQEKYLLVAKFDDKSGIYEVKGEDIVGYGLLCKKIGL